MTWLLRSLLACAGLLCLPAQAQESNGCPAGSYSVISSPDGTTLSILFDQFTIANNANAVSGAQRKVCRITSPLNLPAGYSIGVYKVDYRGFAKLAAKQETALDVQYFLGPRDNADGRVFKRKIKGPHENDYLFTENIGAGQMKRVGCGAAAMLDVSITLSLDGKLRRGAAMASLDTTDAAPGAALVYHLNLKPCPS
ncbi:DUF4360 domain-containing protein [Vogesella indigofera]|uniref:DUF4360 domain-containing protein n=1 Tax=Vogesella indigofera TaxID=45465 RepID=A0ABT5I455_VOGIN|nr:DUF4360 domain-containing protein [Vogesella indigofera]MDC7690939.1 DUF4360 domain-containing protein [Vogesella indigofera]